MDKDYKSKKVIAFDLDDTLAVTKSPITDEISRLLVRLIDKYEVCVISGGKFERFMIQVIDRLPQAPHMLTRLHIMPTDGTEYFRFNEQANKWDKQYEYYLTTDQKKRAFQVLEAGAKKLGFWEPNPYGEIIEDRESQVSFSALGQHAPAEIKYKWDPTDEKKKKLRDFVAPLLPDMEARIGGTTSVDITMVGVDKAFGLHKLIEEMKITKADILYIGDALEPGGNDYSVKAMGVDTIAVKDWQETARVIERLLVEPN